MAYSTIFKLNIHTKHYTIPYTIQYICTLHYTLHHVHACFYTLYYTPPIYTLYIQKYRFTEAALDSISLEDMADVTRQVSG